MNMLRTVAPIGSRAFADRLVFHEVGVEVVTERDRLSELGSEYDHLCRVTSNALPFALHEWHLAWWDQLAASTECIRDSLRVHVMRSLDGECVGIVPLVLTRRGLGHFKVGTLSLLGADPNLTELRSPLVARGEELRVAAALRNRLRADGGWDWIRWSSLEGPFTDALIGDARVEWKTPTLDYVLDLAPTWESLRKRLKRNIRESLRHCYNSLKRDGLAFEFEIAETPEAVRRGLEVFLSLHALRATRTDTVVHPNRFGGEGARRFLFDVCGRLARRGVARVFQLKLRGTVVAARIAFVVGDSLYLYYSGFDPAWARYGVSTTVVAEAIKYAISLGLTTVNLSTGTDVSKTRWGARAVSYREAVEPHPRVRSQVAYAAYRQVVERPNGWLQPLLRALPRREWL
jgi:CelD/BcsL family acetyltransferase involved in cellulose biosynthesis